MTGVRIAVGAALILAAAVAIVLGISALNTGDGQPANPQPSPGVPSGYEVERVRVGDRDLWCVSRYNGGVWCDGTREAS